MLISTLLLGACEQSPEPCPVGQSGCECTVESLCIAGLSCIDDVCQTMVSDGSDSSSTGVSDTDGSTNADGSTDSSSATDLTDSDSSSTDGLCPPPQIECMGDCVNPLTDAQNCGDCGNVCIIEGEYGGCVNGECMPSLSECISWANPIACDDVCAQAGLVCAEAACQGLTYITYDVNAACVAHDPSGASADPCTEPSFVATGSYRCCCAQ